MLIQLHVIVLEHFKIILKMVLNIRINYEYWFIL